MLLPLRYPDIFLVERNLITKTALKSIFPSNSESVTKFSSYLGFWLYLQYVNEEKESEILNDSIYLFLQSLVRGKQSFKKWLEDCFIFPLTHVHHSYTYF